MEHKEILIYFPDLSRREGTRPGQQHIAFKRSVEGEDQLLTPSPAFAGMGEKVFLQEMKVSHITCDFLDKKSLEVSSVSSPTTQLKVFFESGVGIHRVERLRGSSVHAVSPTAYLPVSLCTVLAEMVCCAFSVSLSLQEMPWLTRCFPLKNRKFLEWNRSLFYRVCKI